MGTVEDWSEMGVKVGEVSQSKGVEARNSNVWVTEVRKEVERV
jgi:hypothetical protein